MLYYHCVTAVLSNAAEDALLRRLLDTEVQDLRSIPVEHHVGEMVHLKISLALRKIIRMVVRC